MMSERVLLAPTQEAQFAPPSVDDVNHGFSQDAQSGAVSLKTSAQSVCWSSKVSNRPRSDCVPYTHVRVGAALARMPASPSPAASARVAPGKNQHVAPTTTSAAVARNSQASQPEEPC